MRPSQVMERAGRGLSAIGRCVTGRRGAVLKRAAVFALVLVLTGTAFAQKSNTKRATEDLIEDNIVDVIDTGNGEDTTLVFFGYDHGGRRAEAGWGHQFGDLWLSLYDGYSFRGNEATTDSVWSDTVASDGVNTDYVDEGETAEWNLNNTFKNTLRVAAAWNNKVGASFYWKADHNKYDFGGNLPGTDGNSISNNGYRDATSTGTTTLESWVDHATGTTYKLEWDTMESRKNTNTFGLDFNGVETPKIGGVNFYVALNTIEVGLGSTSHEAAWTETKTLNGSTVGAGAQTSYDGEFCDFSITPLINFELGLDIARLFGVVQTSFVLKEEFAPTFYTYDCSSDLTEVTETTASRTTKITSRDITADDRFAWTNTLTPRFNFTYDADERLTLKSRIDIPVTFGNRHIGAYGDTMTTTTTVYDKTSGTSTRTEVIDTRAKSGTEGSDRDTFTTKVDPTLSFGMVYKLVPGKFNLNLGAKLKTGLLTWTTEEQTYSDQVRTTVTKKTDESGYTYTETVRIRESASGDTTNDDGSPNKNTVTKTFESAVPSGEVNLGGTWFLTDHVQLDMLFAAFTQSGSSSDSFNWKLNVAFGLHF